MTGDARKLGGVPPERIAGVLPCIHWAAQVVAAPGASWAPFAEDHSHTALSWAPELARMVGVPIGTDRPLRAALDPREGAIEVLAGSAVRARRPLAGLTLDEATRWLAGVMREGTDVPRKGPLLRPDHELPDHPIGQGAPFEAADAAAAAELARWFAHAADILEELEPTALEASPVRIWPHHFDIARLLRAPDESGEHARSVGVGLSPGDDSYAEPYWYVTPWPYPSVAPADPLPGGGRWHTRGFTAAVLTASELLRAPTGAEHRAHAVAFLGVALAACRRALDLP